ncbi:FAD-dependent monooxygenase [Peribacillus butanolivorans]|uniref:FAD-dependent monooxygenase n=1 Tax=Peribacillus butanolivorans TaxID=421767 RepID=UPI00070D5FBF|nr:FAD-dependent monooxygenase [Peribacillus butanolivorans]KRF67139.1 FAD-binding protein [Bacillus sp. Soil768D1]MCO0597686.1 FAD-dependent monooxygenase [Peribacillus butanolivorans]
MVVKSDVCIVGSGPGGALLGYLLAKQGISVILLERHSEVAREFRGEFLNDEGESILKKHGLFEDVEELGLLRMEQIEYWQDGQVFKRIFPEVTKDNLGIHVPQNHLLTAILNEAEKLDSFQLMMNTRVTDLIQNEMGQFTGVEARKEENNIRVESSLIIGADGRFSTVRKKAKIPVVIKNHGYDLLWAKIPAPQGWKPSIKMALVNDSQLALFTQAGGFIQIGWNIEHGSYPHLRKQPFEPFIEKLILAFPELKSVVRENIRSWQDFILLDVHSSYCETWTKDGVALLGDAAHTMTPTGAFGLNCAMKDADILADLIQECIKQQDTSFFGLKMAEPKRKAEIEKLQAVQVDKEISFASQFAVYV